MDTLEFPPHNSLMPQISSTDQLLMADQDMTDALKYPHLGVHFSTIGYVKITVLTKLAYILNKKNQQDPSASNKNGAKDHRK